MSPEMKQSITVLPQRAIRSYVLRSGRLTTAQQHALTTLFPRYGLTLSATADHCLDLNAVFGRNAPKHLEIGFGMGDALLAMAAAQPEHDFIGIEVHRPGIGRVLIGITEQGLSNVRVIGIDAVTVLQHHIAAHCLQNVYIFFPDPWHKKRHHKRRLIQPDFIRLLATRMVQGGTLHLATDWEAYAQHMLTVLEAEAAFKNLAGQRQFAPRPASRPLTKFEKRGQRLGHGVWDLLYQRMY